MSRPMFGRNCQVGGHENLREEESLVQRFNHVRPMTSWATRVFHAQIPLRRVDVKRICLHPRPLRGHHAPRGESHVLQGVAEYYSMRSMSLKEVDPSWSIHGIVAPHLPDSSPDRRCARPLARWNPRRSLELKPGEIWDVPCMVIWDSCGHSWPVYLAGRAVLRKTL